MQASPSFIMHQIQFILPGQAFIEHNDIELASAEIEADDINVILQVNDELTDRRDFEYIENMYRDDLQLYANVSETRNKVQEG